MTSEECSVSPNEGEPTASIVIVAFHRPQQLARLLRHSWPASTELVVVAVEEDADVVAEALAVGAICVPLVGNPGFGAAVNAGVAVARGRIVVVSNDDVEFRPGVASALAHEAASRMAVVVPRLRTRSGSVEPTIFALPSPWTLLVEWALTPDVAPPLLGRVLPIEKWRRPTSIEAIEAAAATVFACPARILRVHPMPECYFLYWEEAEWFWDLRRANEVVWYTPELEVVHDGGRADVRPDKSRLLARNAIRCVRRTQGQSRALMAWPVVVLWNMRLVIVELLRSRPRHSSARLSARLAGLGAALTALREAA